MRSTLITILMSATLLFIATPAFALTTWEATSTISVPSAPGQDIDKISITDGGSKYTFDMFLKGKPAMTDVGTQYNIYVGANPHLPDYADYLSNANAIKWLRLSSTTMLIPSFVTSEGDVKTPTFTTYFSGTTNRLEWIVDKGDITTVASYFMGTTEKGVYTIDHTNVGNMAATPIPAAAWLLASGLFCLIGLKRKA